MLNLNHIQAVQYVIRKRPQTPKHIRNTMSADAVSTYKQDQEAEFKAIVSTKYHGVDCISEQLENVKIVGISDEWFAEASNLTKSKAPIQDKTKFVFSGAWYDGWETRRHNENEYDYVIFKIGVEACKIIGCEVDTAFFNGNQAPFVGVDALYHDDAEEANSTSNKITNEDERWESVITKTECGPSQKQFFLRNEGLTTKHFNYIKLKMYPDGGIARFRLYGKVVPGEHTFAESNVSAGKGVDFAFVGHGGVALKCSDQHFGSKDNLLLPGHGIDMGDGWETARSRVEGHVDWTIIKLCKTLKHLNEIVVDTSFFRGNFPQYVKVLGINEISDDKVVSWAEDDSQWTELVGKSKTGPDKEHFFEFNKDIELTHVKLVIIPDGGVKRVRVFGY